MREKESKILACAPFQMFFPPRSGRRQDDQNEKVEIFLPSMVNLSHELTFSLIFWSMLLGGKGTSQPSTPKEL